MHKISTLLYCTKYHNVNYFISGLKYLGQEFAPENRIRDFGPMLIKFLILSCAIPYWSVTFFFREDVGLISMEICRYFQIEGTTTLILFLLTEPFIQLDIMCYMGFTVAGILHIYLVMYSWLQRSWQVGL